MKIYLSSRYDRRMEMVVVANALAKTGHEIVSTWIQQEKDEIDSWYAATLAERDLSEISACDAFVAFTERPGTPGAARGGRLVELGGAAILGKRIIAVGSCRENIFHELSKIEWVSTKIDLLRLIGPARQVA